MHSFAGIPWPRNLLTWRPKWRLKNELVGNWNKAIVPWQRHWASPIRPPHPWQLRVAAFPASKGPVLVGAVQVLTDSNILPLVVITKEVIGWITLPCTRDPQAHRQLVRNIIITITIIIYITTVLTILAKIPMQAMTLRLPILIRYVNLTKKWSKNELKTFVKMNWFCASIV